jgi:UDP-glucose 4-epimerase
MNSKPRVLITGCAGLFGANFSRYLLDRNYEVVGIDDLSGGYSDNIDPRTKIYIFNLIDLKSLENIFEAENPEYVYHFAAYASEGLSPFIRNYNYTNNVLCSVNVINSCINYNVKKLIFTSSMGVYGKQLSPFTEDMSPMPIDPYGIAKYAVELDLKAAYEHFGLKYSIVRPQNVHGIYQNIWDKYRNVLGIWIRQTLNKENLSVYGDGMQQRAFSDIKYYHEPLEKLMYGFDGEIFNLGADRHYKIKDAAEIVQNISKTHGYEVGIDLLEPRNEVKDAFSDHSKAKRMLNFKDETHLEELINEMIIWAKNKKPKTVKYMDYEIEKNMYSYWKK